LDELLGVPTLASETGYNTSATVHNLLQFWKLTDKFQVGLLGFDATSVIYCVYWNQEFTVGLSIYYLYTNSNETL